MLLKLLLSKRGNHFWQMVLLILAVLSLVIAMIIIASTNNEVNQFSDWLQWVT